MSLGWSAWLLVVAIAAPGISQTAGIEPSAIEAAAKAELESTHTPGAAIGIVQNGRLVYSKGVGTRDLETGDPVTEQTLFRLGSTTKMMTAAAVASFAAEGRLDFADRVGKHISGLDSAIAALTVNQILSHTSGLKDEAVMNGRHDDQALGEEIRHWNAEWLFTKPGAIYSYANPGFWLAGYLAETLGGKPYADVMEERIFHPLGMTWTTLRPTMAMTRIFSQGHDQVNGELAVLRPAPDNAANWPAGSVFSNLADLSRLVTALMDDGKIGGKQVLSPKVVAAMTVPHAKIPGSKATYGYGLELDDTGGTLTWSHAGSRAGYGSFIEMIPARHAAVIVLANRTGENLPRTHAMILRMLGKKSDPDAANTAGAPIDRAEFAKYLGLYRNGATRIEIAERGGKLFMRGMEVTRTSDGWLVMKDAQGKPAGRAFPVAGATERIDYLFMGGRSAARVE